VPHFPHSVHSFSELTHKKHVRCLLLSLIVQYFQFLRTSHTIACSLSGRTSIFTRCSQFLSTSHTLWHTHCLSVFSILRRVHSYSVLYTKLHVKVGQYLTFGTIFIVSQFLNTIVCSLSVRTSVYTLRSQFFITYILPIHYTLFTICHNLSFYYYNQFLSHSHIIACWITVSTSLCVLRSEFFTA
jgi:hypothetical protein